MVGPRTPRSASTSSLRKLQWSGGNAMASVQQSLSSLFISASALPLAALAFSLALTALVALWAQTAYQHPSPSLLHVSKGTSGGGTHSGGGGGGGGESSGRALIQGESQGSVNLKSQPHAVNAAPFLSDVLPESEGSKKRAAPLTKEEHELSNAEAVYRNNIIRRSEVMKGARPEAPFREWNAGKMREVFLNPTYPCPQKRRLGSQERGKWLCNPLKLKNKPVIIYTFGALEDLSFEAAAFRQLGPHTMVHVFTPWLSAKEERNLMAESSEARQFLASYHPIGVCANERVEDERKKALPGKEFMSFPQILAKMDHPRIDILKIDCEGCETGLFQELARTYKREHPPFNQVVVEIHSARQPRRTLPLILALEDMGFRLFHVEPDSRSSQRFELSYLHENVLHPSGVPQP